MHAWRINQLGQPSEALSYEEIPEPVPGPGEVAIRVEAATINFADILVCQGIYQDRPSVPFTPGLEACGTVTAVGEGVDIPVGTRIAGMAALPAGGFASGTIPSYPGNHVLVKNYAVIGLHWAAYPQHGGQPIIKQAHEDIIRLYRAGKIHTDISATVDLTGVAGALNDLQQRRVAGRVVMLV